VILYHVREILI